MLREAMEVFQKMLEQKDGERIVLDNHIPKDGTYRMIEIHQDSFITGKMITIRNDKKNGRIIGQEEESYPYFRALDYYSKLLEMNKPMDQTKTLHGNNYLSLIVKKENIVSGKLSQKILNGYYEVLKDPSKKYEKKPKTKSLYDNLPPEIGKPDQALISRIQQYISSADIWEGMDLEKKDYAKIFFVFPDKNQTLEVYKKENKRYIIPNIYNNNEFNEEDEREIVGLPNNNMGLNSKKPFLENKSRKVKVPYLLNQKTAFLQMQLFDYFMGEVSKGKIHIYIDTDEDEAKMHAYSNTEEPQFLEYGYYMRFRKEKNEVAILQADVVTCYSPNLPHSLWLKNYIGIPEKILEKSKTKYNTAYSRLWEIKKLIDVGFFEGKLGYNFDSDSKDIAIQDQIVKQCLLESRSRLASWFYTGQEKAAIPVVKKFTLEIIKNSLVHGEILKAQRQFNIMWSLLDYFEPNRRIGEQMERIKSILRTHINLSKDQEWQIESDEEYAFAVGQTVSYFITLSKSNNRPDSLINPFLNAKNDELIKHRIGQLYKKYNYQISHNTIGRVSQLMYHVLEYKPAKICQNEMIMGFLAPILIFEKKKEESEDK